MGGDGAAAAAGQAYHRAHTTEHLRYGVKCGVYSRGMINLMAFASACVQVDVMLGMLSKLVMLGMHAT